MASLGDQLSRTTLNGRRSTLVAPGVARAFGFAVRPWGHRAISRSDIHGSRSGRRGCEGGTAEAARMDCCLCSRKHNGKHVP